MKLNGKEHIEKVIISHLLSIAEMKTRINHVLHQFLLSYLIVLTESSIDGVKDSCHLPSSLDTSCTCISNYLQCTGINSTQSLQSVQSHEARTITQVEILNSDLKCLDLEHFSRFEFVKVIKVALNASNVKEYQRKLQK